MADFNIYGPDGSLVGTASSRYYDDSVGGGGILIIIPYILSLIGGIIMLVNVGTEAPICIVPAVLGFIVLLLLPIFILVKIIGGEKVSIKYFLIKAVNFSNYLFVILLLCWWTLFFSQATSEGLLYTYSFGLMYCIAISMIFVCRKLGWKVGVFICLIPAFVIYLVGAIVIGDMPLWLFMIIPTYVILSSLIITSIATFRKSILSKLLLGFIVLAFIFEAFVGVTYSTNNEEKLEQAKLFIEQGQYQEARLLLEHNSLDEAKSLYSEIRYKDLKKGDIIYNGYFSNTDKKSIDDNGASFICLDVIDGVAYLISNDLLFFTDEPSYYYDFDTITSRVLTDFDVKNMDKLKDNQHYFSVPTLEDFNKYKEDKEVKQLFLDHKLPKQVKKDLKKILEDDSSYAWGGRGNKADNDSWFVYDDVANKFYHTTDELELSSESIYNHYYYGIRICYKVKVM